MGFRPPELAENTYILSELPVWVALSQQPEQMNADKCASVSENLLAGFEDRMEKLILYHTGEGGWGHTRLSAEKGTGLGWAWLGALWQTPGAGPPRPERGRLQKRLLADFQVI